MNRAFIRRHITSFAIVIFISIYGLLVYTKPKFMYLDDGCLRQFGVDIGEGEKMAILNAIRDNCRFDSKVGKITS